MDQKEPRFFTDFAQRDWTGPAAGRFRDRMLTTPEAYAANFAGLMPGQWAIDASTDYLWCPASLERIAARAETCRVKLVCVTRDPVERAVSEYNHTLRHGWETLDFTDSLAEEPARRAAGCIPLFYHRRRSEIAGDLARYHDVFGGDLLVLDFDRMTREGADATVARVCAFLDEPAFAVTRREARNNSVLPRNRVVGALRQNATFKRLVRPVIPKGLRKELWDRAHVDARRKLTVRLEEKAAFRASLAEEIAACRALPFVETDGWEKTAT
jgi:hypothetical protein